MSGQDGGGRTRRINWTLFWTAAGSLAAIGALLLALNIVPSSDSGGAESPVVTSTGKGDPEKSGEPIEGGLGGDGAQAGEELWSGEIVLVVDKDYALDGFPIKPLEGYCDGCIMVNGFTPEPSLEVENGIRDWSRPAPPSYEDCAQLLESGPIPSIVLVTSPNIEGIEVGGWACAFSKSGEIVRLHYLGESQDEVTFRFMATGWREPS